MAGLVVGVPKEIKDKEGRVSVQPDGVAELAYHDRADPNLIPRSAHFAYNNARKRGPRPRPDPGLRRLNGRSTLHLPLARPSLKHGGQ